MAMGNSNRNGNGNSNSRQTKGAPGAKLERKFECINESASGRQRAPSLIPGTMDPKLFRRIFGATVASRAKRGSRKKVQ